MAKSCDPLMVSQNLFQIDIKYNMNGENKLEENNMQGSKMPTVK